MKNARITQVELVLDAPVLVRVHESLVGVGHGVVAPRIRHFVVVALAELAVAVADAGAPHGAADRRRDDRHPDHDEADSGQQRSGNVGDAVLEPPALGVCQVEQLVRICRGDEPGRCRRR